MSDFDVVPREVVSRHSPEGFEEVLKASAEEGVPALSFDEDRKGEAIEAARLLVAWAGGQSLQFRYAGGLDAWADHLSGYAPNVLEPALEWRIKRTPRKVWVAFHESGSWADVRATEPGPDGSLRAAAEDYIEFEEKLS